MPYLKSLECKGKMVILQIVMKHVGIYETIIIFLLLQILNGIYEIINFLLL
ncbi:hypothetical protein Hanom_Chr14g01286241 [Helianthus anomalus]